MLKELNLFGIKLKKVSEITKLSISSIQIKKNLHAAKVLLTLTELMSLFQISDQKCPPPRPHTSENCNIPNCDEENTGSVRHLLVDSKRAKAKEHTDAFRDGPVYTVTVNGSDDIGPEYNFGAVGGWLFTDWSEVIVLDGT